MNYFKEAVCFDPVNYYLMLDEEDLLKLKKNLSTFQVNQLKTKLEGICLSYRALKRSVIYKKKPLKGIDKKDYVSLATYYWPNPSTPSGLPYVSRDGEANPEGLDYDKDKLRELAFISYYQCLLYYLTEDTSYYQSFKDNITYFFLDEKTGMNPNLNHAQLIRGVNEGRGIGIIDFTANFTYPIRLMKLLYNLGKIEDAFYLEFASWLKQFANWMCYSKNGLEEKYAKNNHGIFYDLGLAAIYDYLNQPLQIAPLVFQMIEYRMSYQICEDGSMPAENERTKSKNYSLMGLKGLYDFNTIVKGYGYNLYELDAWYYRKVNFDLLKAIQFLYRHLVLKEEEWGFLQIIPFDEATLIPLLYECKKIALLNQIPNLSHFEMKCDILKILVEEKPLN
ncbi:MAG: alginate lyase family protein [Roseburia sp.]|nr:alginate lyase family protein [Anaeroplasma bactoclasticum]MCM1196206.1 alginate lyase family protein [Roseburia sp.]MCM1556027.1 alginate lyase family protein [Anaeroplasma bactoclasticum]